MVDNGFKEVYQIEGGIVKYGNSAHKAADVLNVHGAPTEIVEE